MLANPATFGFLAEQGAPEPPRAVGFCLARATRGECEVLSLGVDPAHRRRGFGRRLMDAIMAAALDRDCTTFYLEAGAANVAALGLYLERGFTIVGRRKGYYRTAKDGAMDALVLRYEGASA